MRALAGIALCASILLAGPAVAPPEAVSRIAHQQQMTQTEIKQRFDQAVVMLHAKEYEHAATALHRVLRLAPRMPEAHVNMGFALLGLGQGEAALRFFQSAIEIKPQQANAYYGMAMAAELSNDFELARGGMRAFLHLAKPDDPHRAKARAALWEWEGKGKGKEHRH